ncbi:MAG: serine protease [Planctomycetota bacterium]|nr:MAG: serine protease [Planctomycetota bacterium]
MTLRSAALAFGLFASSLPAVAQDSDAQQLATLLEKVAPSVVNVRIVLKVEVTAMGQVVQNQEERSSATGVVVDPSGLIMISNSAVSADRVNKMIAASGREGIDVSIRPTDLKVIFEGGEKEHPAFLAASEPDLDLAFVQLESVEGLELQAVSFADSPKPTVGQRLVQVSRLSEGFDYAPHFSLGRVSGKIRKPRKAFSVTGNFIGPGLPLYDLQGAALGVLTSLESGVQESSSRLAQAMGGGAGHGAFLLPAKKVRGVVQQALQRAKEVAAERAKAPKVEQGDEAPSGEGGEAAPSGAEGQ